MSTEINVYQISKNDSAIFCKINMHKLQAKNSIFWVLLYVSLQSPKYFINLMHSKLCNKNI